jgi:hypothetical protein
MERGFSISSYRLHRLVGVAQSTALNILRKVRTVLERHMKEPKNVFPQSEFRAVMNRRSRSTPANKHPMSEEESPESGKSESDNLGDKGGDKMHDDFVQSANRDESEDTEATLWQQKIDGLGENAKVIFEVLSQTVPQSIDEICSKTGLEPGKVAASITILELDELIECPFTNNYVRSSPDGARKQAGSLKASNRAGFASGCAGAFRRFQQNDLGQTSKKSGTFQSSTNGPKATGAKSVEEEVEEEELRKRLFKYLFQSFDGVSRKYLQLYLASYWCFSDRAYWFAGQLFSACFRSSPVTYDELLLYASPRELKVIESNCEPHLGVNP